MFAIIDCNNFYASCERLFRPDLHEKPIIVLSNNDGCVIARSNEAKALGIAMGEPYFRIKALCQQHKIHTFSSNYALYGDLSQRVMHIIEENWPQVEIYSIDEAFLDLSSLPNTAHEDFCLQLQRLILKATGIPTSIGIGPTKTLAKMANHVCKKELKIPVFNISKQRQWLQRASVGDVWGVGRQWHKKLVSQGIYTAQDLAQCPPLELKRQFNIMLMRTALELQGIPCQRLAEHIPPKSILSSRSFGSLQTSFEALAEAVSSHCARACEKLRQHGLLASHLTVFIRTNPFRQDLAQYRNSITTQLITPSDDVRFITGLAKEALKKIVRPGFEYKKAGVCLDDLRDKNQRQADLFYSLDPVTEDKNERLMLVMDNINHTFGRHTIRLAAEGFQKPWAMRSNQRSPCYTTRWSDLKIVKT